MDMPERSVKGIIEKVGSNEAAKLLADKMYSIDLGNPHKTGKGFKLRGRSVPLRGILISNKTYHRGSSSQYFLEDGALLNTAHHYGSAAQKAWFDFQVAE